MKYYIADQHFYHANMIKYENRGFVSADDMNDFMVRMWNKVVTDKDEVYILGDFGFCSGEQANALLKSLNGRKYLVKGNHDRFLRDPEFDKSLFVWIKDYYVVTDGQYKVVLFHYPIAVWDCKHYGSIHLYGHIHSGGSNLHPAVKELKNAYNVGVDVIGYSPKTLSDIMGKK